MHYLLISLNRVAKMKVLVMVGDANDNSPSFSSTNYSVILSEAYPIRMNSC